MARPNTMTARAAFNLFAKGIPSMNDRLQTMNPAMAGQDGLVLQQRNKVLRNTYWLLALSLLPTVLGAWLGVSTGLTRSLSGGMGLIVFLGGAFGFMYAIEKTKNSAAVCRSCWHSRSSWASCCRG